jgi:uroporphyrinogen decarboxylase
MTTREQLVRQAIRFERPERIPVWYVNCDQTAGDAIVYHLSLERSGAAGTSEWGYRLEKLGDGTMGHPVHAHLPDWQSAEGFTAPPLRASERMAAAPEFFRWCEDRYRMASLDLSGFTVYMLLRGFENSMTDFLTEPERSAWLLDMILDWECEVMTLVARQGFHAIHFADDWGTQTGLMIAPALWRRLFKHRYAGQFAHARRLGLDVWFHCCGNLTELVDDFHEIGCDVLNIAQPNVVDVAEVSRRLRGRQCFLIPVSYQTVSIQGTTEEIYAEAQRLYDLLGTGAGGFIGYVEQYGCMGMSASNYQACGEAFRRLRPCAAGVGDGPGR